MFYRLFIVFREWLVDVKRQREAICWKFLSKAETLAFRNIVKHSFVVESDQIEVMAGTFSSDIKLQQTMQVVR